MADLTTLAAVKAYLAITTTNQDSLISSLITRESAQIERWTGRSFTPVTYTEWRLNGSGTGMLTLPDTPIQSLSALAIDGVAVPLSTDGLTAGYTVDESTVYLIGSKFPARPQCVVCSWVAGYAATPAQVEQACIEMVGIDLKSRDNLGVQSKTLANESISYSDKGMNASVREMLQPYRKMVPA